VSGTAHPKVMKLIATTRYPLLSKQLEELIVLASPGSAARRRKAGRLRERLSTHVTSSTEPGSDRDIAPTSPSPPLHQVVH